MEAGGHAGGREDGRAAQLELFSAHAPGHVRQALEARAGRPVELLITRNRTSMISVRRVGDGVRVRMHEAFLQAPGEVLTALGEFLARRRREDWAVVSAFARRIPHRGLAAAVERPKGGSKGRVHDLGAILDEVRIHFFGGRSGCRIEWGRLTARNRRRVRYPSIRYASWDVQTRTIRVNPLLDDERVPVEFMRYLAFHEFLHTLIPPVLHGTRVSVHPPQFKALEKRYPGYADMRKLSRVLMVRLRRGR